MYRITKGSRKVKAFIGRDFDEKYDSLVAEIEEHIDAHEIECVDAKKVKSKLVDVKITDLILDCEIFVGIFTRDKEIFGNHTWKRFHYRPPEKKRAYTTSDWVIQESGFAIGSDRKLILLVERGVERIPKLQGNLEYISFDRNSIKVKFTKLTQLIVDIKKQIIGGVAKQTTDEIKRSDEAKIDEQIEPSKVEIGDKKTQLLNKLTGALYKERNISKAQKIFEEELKSLLSPDEKISFLGYILRESHKLGDQEAFRKLQQMVKDSNNNPLAIKQIAYHLKETGEYEKAKNQFLLAKSKCNINLSEDKKRIVECYIQAAWCLALDDNYDAAIDLLRESLFESNLKEYKANILGNMAYISKNKDHFENFFFYAEAVLENDPYDTGLRFDLAYAYSDNKNEKLALLHYKKLTTTMTEHNAGLNNLGVSYDRLELDAKSVKNFLKAANNDSTLAMANLASGYLNEGFTDDARKLIDKANKLYRKGIEVHPNISASQSRLMNMFKEEKEKEKGILLEANKERKFRIKYVNSLYSDKTVSKDQIEGTWETPWGNEKLNYDESTKSFNIEIQKEEIDLNLITALLAPTGVIPEYKPEKKFQNISIKGTFDGLAGKYNVRISGGKEAPTLLTGEADTAGHLILNDDLNNMSVMEKTKDGKIEFKQWKKHEENVVK